MHICPKCGAKEGTKKFVGPFCIDCYKFKIKIPDKIEIIRCRRCGRVKLMGKWSAYSDEKIAEYVKGKFKGEFTSAEFFPSEKKARFGVDRDNTTIEMEKDVNFAILTDMCPDCNKKAGGYFEAIIQLRGNEQRIVKYARIFREMLEEAGTFISKVEEGKDGLDLYVGSTPVAIMAIKRLGLTHLISRKLAGQKQGKRLYRTTFAIRL